MNKAQHKNEDIVVRLRECPDLRTVPVREAADEIESLRKRLYEAYSDAKHWYYAYLRLIEQTEPRDG